jgi:hypothetical protein
MVLLKRKFACAHCGAKFVTRAGRVVHEASECPERPTTRKAR